MNLALFKRVRTHAFPGSIGRAAIIRLRERSDPDDRANGWRRALRARTRAVLKDRAQRDEQSEAR